MRRRRKLDRAYDVDMSISREKDKVSLGIPIRDYARFVFYSLLLIFSTGVLRDYLILIKTRWVVEKFFIGNMFYPN